MTASLGLGTCRVRAVDQAARIACADGSVWLDTAPNYADAQQVLGPVIADYPPAMVATKTGFFTRAEGEAAGQAGVITSEQVAAGHSLRPAFTRWQAEHSLAVLGRVDLVFVHNPEHSALDRADLHGRLRSVFAALEEFATAGRISGYGVATWSGFQHGAFTVPELLGLAKEAAGSGENHCGPSSSRSASSCPGRSLSPWTVGGPWSKPVQRA